MWFVTASSPLGKETYNIRLNDDGSGSISHDRGSVEFLNASITEGPDFLNVKISGSTEIPLSVDFLCEFQSSGKSLSGTATIGQYAKIQLDGIKI